ncbi:MAG: acyl-CoA synthetase, partial [Desulfobacterales bacterium]|nr:acyl-CoA synthetase [Desulfobacterales bacterium]
NATFAPTFPEVGRMGFLSQSGGLGVAIIDQCQALGLGVSSFVSVGNKVDVSANDLLEFWEDDPNTDVILLYLESFGNPRRFTPIARRVARKKPILAVKAGRTASGRRAASSHTGALAGIDLAADALFRQAGVIRTDTLGELFSTAMVLVSQPIPNGRRTAILTNAGGPGILAADACEQLGLELPSLSDDTVAKLREILPAEASTANPVDMVASANAENYKKAAEILFADDGIDILMVIFIPPMMTQPHEIAEAARRLGEREGGGQRLWSGHVKLFADGSLGACIRPRKRVDAGFPYSRSPFPSRDKLSIRSRAFR